MQVVAWNVAGQYPREAICNLLHATPKKAHGNVDAVFLAEMPLARMPALRRDAAARHFRVSRSLNAYYGKTTVMLTHAAVGVEVTWPLDRVARLAADGITLYAVHAPSLHNGARPRIVAREAWDAAFQRLLGAAPTHTAVVGDYNYDFDDARARSLTTTPLDILACNMSYAAATAAPAATFHSRASGSLTIDMLFYTPDLATRATCGAWVAGIDHAPLHASICKTVLLPLARPLTATATTATATMPRFAAVRLDYDPASLAIIGIQVRASPAAAGATAMPEPAGADTMETFLTAPLAKMHPTYQRMYSSCEVQPLARVLPALGALLADRHVIADASHHRVWEHAFGPAVVALVNWVAIDHATDAPMGLIVRLWKAGVTIPAHKLRPPFKATTLAPVIDASNAPYPFKPKTRGGRDAAAAAAPQQSPPRTASSSPPPQQQTPSSPQSPVDVQGEQANNAAASPASSPLQQQPQQQSPMQLEEERAAAAAAAGATEPTADIAAWCVEMYEDLMPMLTATRDAAASELQVVRMRRVNAALSLFEKRVAAAKAELDEETRQAYTAFAAACAELPVSKKIARHEAQRSKLPRRAAAEAAMARMATMQ